MVESAANIPNKTGRLWPLDVLIAALAGMILYLICTRLSFQDPRLQYNATTYAVGIPLVALVADFVLRGVASRYVQKSLQIGFLFSVWLHLLMLMLATSVVIFNHYYPEVVMGRSPDRKPVKRTVPEYLFKTAPKREAQPDWSLPSEAETASPVVPTQRRSLPPVEQAVSRLAMPTQRIRKPDREHLQRRDQTVEAQPQPADSPARLARRTPLVDSPAIADQSQPVAPEVSVVAKLATPGLQLDAAEDSLAMRRQSSLRSSSPSRSSPSPTPPVMTLIPDPSKPSPAQRRSDQTSLPRIGDLGIGRPTRSTSQPQRIAVVGAAPSINSVAIARRRARADRVLSPLVTERPERGQRENSVAITAPTRPVSVDRPDEGSGVVFNARRSPNGSAAGVPKVPSGLAWQRSPPTRNDRLPRDVRAAGVPDPSAIASLVQSGAASSTDALQSSSADQQLIAGDTDTSQPRRPRRATIGSPKIAGPSLDLLAPEGPVGFADSTSRRAGVVPADQRPRVASVDLTVGPRPRRQVGGPVTPLGAEVASVESFNRRIMRTRGGRVPTPSGAVGPATEEAIERGLAYLQSIQNEDGSWSLQGHGTKVILRSDTAATGLCLLAFQGAGYTHKQHQFASTVRKGIDFLQRSQKSNGDLFRAEDAISNQNVALYSHGIAALALSEAYGMTQDPELRQVAQDSLNFIADTQHKKRGGWRYSPQVSSDTSVSGWMMMALKSGELSGLEVSEQTYQGIDDWLDLAQSPSRQDRYRYDPFAPDTPTQRHGRLPTPTMTAVGILMRMYSGWQRDAPEMRSAAEYLLKYPPRLGTRRSPQRDAYYWYYATQVMFHMGGTYWRRWNQDLNPVLLESQLTSGPYAGSWDPKTPVPDRWSIHAGRLYVTTMALLNLEVYYRHLPIYEDTAR